MANFPPLPCSKILFRAVLHESQIKNGKLKWQVFKRLEKDRDGVSLFTTIENASEGLKRPFAGMSSVHVGRIRDISDNDGNLDVEQDEEFHANILGIPYIWDKTGAERTISEDRMIFLCRQIAKSAARLITKTNKKEI